MRIVFMGTPDFAVPSLEALLAAGHEVCGVFTQPDKPKNRGMKLLPPPVKVTAQSHGIPVFQPTQLRGGSALEELRALAPELIVVAAYGRILPQEILDLPPKGCINVHSSLLPRYRGAAPINWAVVNGDKETGVTIMEVAPELDAGDILGQVSTPIDPEETVETVHNRLAGLGGELLVRVVEEIAAGTVRPIPQDPALVTYAPMLSRALSPIDWNQGANAIHNKVRGLVPWPATSTDVFSKEPVKIFSVAETGEHTHKAPGTVISARPEGIDVACGDGMVLRILELQAPGSRRMAAADYLRGHPISIP